MLASFCNIVVFVEMWAVYRKKKPIDEFGGEMHMSDEKQLFGVAV